MNVSELLEVTDGKLLCGKKDTEIGAFVINSKSVKSGSCFLAIKGEKNDGNCFIDEAIENGATVILSDKHPVTCGGLYGLDKWIRDGNVSFVLVEDIYKAVRQAAKHYRESYLENVIAVTGSVGKTTVKELIFSVLSERMDIYKTEGNKNNNLGLPLSVFSGNKSKNAVFELGISNFGEMKELSDIAAPSVAVVTNIGSAHIEFLYSRENIAAEKLKIISGMRRGGTLIVNGDEPLLTDFINDAVEIAKNFDLERTALKGSASYSAAAHIKTVTVSEKNESSDYYVYNVSFFEDGTYFDIKKHGKLLFERLFVPITGKHGALDAAFAVAVGEIYGCSEVDVRKGLKKFTPCGDRQKLENIGKITCLFDCYNACPESFAAAIDAFKILTDSKGAKAKGVVAGSMLELGEASEKEHKKLGKRISDCCPELLITVGAEASFIAEGAKARGMKAENVVSFPDEKEIEAAASEVKKRLPAGSFLLIKGSRGMRLERFREYLK